MAETIIRIPSLHAGQIAAYTALNGHKRAVLRAGRRYGKTELGKLFTLKAAAKGGRTGWLSPQYKTSSQVFAEFAELLRPIAKVSKSEGIIRLDTGGEIEFWTLGNPIAGRSRKFHRVVIDEAAFTKNGDNTVEGSMMSLWEKAINPTLLDYDGEVLVLSNSAGKNPDNFLYQICTDPKYGFVEHHATTMDNPVLPIRLDTESRVQWQARRDALMASLKSDNDPLVYAQEYLAEFVDWSGAAFFAPEKLLVDGRPVPFPARCECVYAVIDTAAKTGTENDSTAVTFFASDPYGLHKMLVLDWDITQIEGATLYAWLPSVFRRLEELARVCGARNGSMGAFIEEASSGIILLQQARSKGLPVHAIKSKLTSLGKDERAISVSSYVYRGLVKYTETAYSKIKVHKQRSMNHLLNQVESFRVGDKDNRREDDLLDTFCYGIALGLGNSEGF